MQFDCRRRYCSRRNHPNLEQLPLIPPNSADLPRQWSGLTVRPSSPRRCSGQRPGQNLWRRHLSRVRDLEDACSISVANGRHISSMKTAKAPAHCCIPKVYWERAKSLKSVTINGGCGTGRGVAGKVGELSRESGTNASPLFWLSAAKSMYLIIAATLALSATRDMRRDQLWSTLLLLTLAQPRKHHHSLSPRLLNTRQGGRSRSSPTANF